MGKYIFISIVLLLVFLFIRIGIISQKAENFVKKRYREYWQENIHCKSASGPWGGSTIFQLAKNLNDPLLQEYEKQWLRAIKYLLIAVLFSVFIVALYIYFFQ